VRVRGLSQRADRHSIAQSHAVTAFRVRRLKRLFYKIDNFIVAVQGDLRKGNYLKKHSHAIF
jgi:hypothetical protein